MPITLVSHPSPVPARSNPSTPGPKFIQGGPSPLGWSLLGAILDCPRRARWSADQRIGQTDMPDGSDMPAALLDEDAAQLGTNIHAGLAQFYARARAAQDGTDPMEWASPEEGIRKADEGKGLADRAIQIVNEFIRTQKFVPRIVGIERVLSCIVDDEEYTQRADLMIESAGRIFIWDYKSTAEIKPYTFESKRFNGQMIGYQFLGKLEFGSAFGGVRIVGIQTTHDPIGRVVGKAVEPCPGLVKDFPNRISVALSIRSRYASRHWSEWPAFSGQMCTAYRRACPVQDYCVRGM